MLRGGEDYLALWVELRGMGCATDGPCGWVLQVVLYCADMMVEDRDLNERVAARLSRAGIGSAAAFLLEAAGPLTVLAAQVGYLVEPLLGTSGGTLNILARMLEDPGKVRDLVVRLREERR
jgi:hypothetical protein